MNGQSPKMELSSKFLLYDVLERNSGTWPISKWLILVPVSGREAVSISAEAFWSWAPPLESPFASFASFNLDLNILALLSWIRSME